MNRKNARKEEKWQRKYHSLDLEYPPKSHLSKAWFSDGSIIGQWWNL